EIRKSGSTWLITKREAKRIYKEEFTMIKVNENWDWAVDHVENELENEVLLDEVSEWANEKNIDLDRVKELYHEGLVNGVEENKYLPFPQWFYEYKEMDE